MDLTPARVERVIASTSDEFAVVVRTASKAFLIFVGQAEAFTIYRELKSSQPRRPLAHDLLMNVMTGFDIEVKSVVISSIVESTFCATLILNQIPLPESDAQERILRLDLRASDAMIVALKSGQDLLVTANVLDQVEDVTHLLEFTGDADEFPA